MRYYRDLQPGETLQAGDERFRGGNEWTAVATELYGLTPSDLQWGLFRRPVDLPVLRPVTPEAMEELERREAIGVLFVCDGRVQIASYNSYRWWWWSDAGCAVDRPTRGWFVELGTLKEVQQ